MSSTYEIIRDLPGKGYDWAGFCNALRAMYSGTFSQDQEARFARTGIRATRNAAMEMAVEIVMSNTCSSFIAPSPETLSWGGCLGGETVVVRDREREEAATQAIAGLAQKFRVPA